MYLKPEGRWLGHRLPGCGLSGMPASVFQHIPGGFHQLGTLADEGVANNLAWGADGAGNGKHRAPISAASRAVISETEANGPTTSVPRQTGK